MRTGNDKSHLARQVERYADIYMARVSALGSATPFAYFRAHRGTLPHDFPDEAYLTSNTPADEDLHSETRARRGGAEAA
jgi:hypothetical protein